MGSGGRASASSDAKERINKRVPCSKPPFSLSDLKKAIPPHCFHRSLLRSSSYLARDLVIIFVLYHLASTYIPLLPTPLSYLAWPLYWFSQGSMMMVLWLFGHECGHQGFSEHQWINDAVGFILHSSIFTPYFSWKYSHRAHHMHTNSLEDEVCYVPKTKLNTSTAYAKVVSNPVGRLVGLIILAMIGYPLYLLTDIFGKKHDRFVSHYVPTSPIFTKRERAHVLLSDAGILLVIYALYRVALAKGATWLTCIYGVPFVVYCSLLILATYLQHTHVSVPFYDSTEWDWMRGSLATIDRNFGSLNWIYCIAPATHGIHHLFPTIPHYHAIEAREAIKPILGDYYKYDDTNVVKALWELLGECIYVEPDDDGKEGIYWFNNKM